MKKNKEESSLNSKAEIRLHDIWALNILYDQDYQKSRTLKRRPILEIYVEENRIIGNDGCNDIFGDFAKLNATQMVFGPIGSTKRACPDIDISHTFHKALQECQSYKLEGLELNLFDKKGVRLMQFRKID